MIMEIYISFVELAMIAEEKMGQKLQFERIDAYSFKVCKQVSIPVIKIKKWVGLGVKAVGFEVVESGEHELKFKAASDIVSWLVGHANGSTINEYADIDGRNLVVHLDKIEKLKEVLEYIEPRSLNFSEEGAVLSADIKTLTADINV